MLTAVEAIDASGGLTDAERVRNQLGYDLYYMPEGSDYKPAELPEEQRVGAAALKFLSP